MSQLPEYQELEFRPLPVYPTVDQHLERTGRQYEPTVADIVRRLSGTQGSNGYICPFCGGSFARTPAALSSCNHLSPSGTQRRPSFNAGDSPGRGSISNLNSPQLDEVLRTMSPAMRQYVVSLEESYQQKMREAGTDENAALQNLQQRMLSMARAQNDLPKFSWNSSNLPRPATSRMSNNRDDAPRIPSVVPSEKNNESRKRVNPTRNDTSPRKSGFWRRK